MLDSLPPSRPSFDPAAWPSALFQGAALRLPPDAPNFLPPNHVASDASSALLSQSRRASFLEAFDAGLEVWEGLCEIGSRLARKTFLQFLLVDPKAISVGLAIGQSQ